LIGDAAAAPASAPASLRRRDVRAPLRLTPPSSLFFSSSSSLSRYALTKSVLIAFGMTFFRFFDIPVFWPILLLYFCVLFTLTMKRQIKHMRKHNYVPWSCGKAKHKDTKKRVAHDGAPQVLQVVAPAPPPAGLKKISRPS
jgi:hypothetical protein